MNVVKVAVCSAGLWCSMVWAQSSNGAPPKPNDMPPVSAEMKAAFEACKSQGKPGDTAFDACMTSKGFKKPEGGQKPPSK